MRQRWVDIAKGIAIIAVVLGHISYKWPGGSLLPLSDLLVWLWHVPVFFMIGGFFLKDEKLLSPLSFIKGKIKGLYLPMIYIYLPVLLIHNVFINIGWYDLDIEYYGKYVTYWGVSDFLKHLLTTLLCAGREPLLGAMWFGFVLFLALCLISLSSWIIKKIWGECKNCSFELVRGLLFLIFAIVSCSLTKLFSLTISRFNNTLVAIWLIYIGYLLVQKARITFTNGFVAAGCALVAWHAATITGGVNLVANDYSDVIELTIASGACLYVICFLSKLLEKVNWLGPIFSRIGRDSLYIMGLHFIGFKFASLLINLFGGEVNLALLVPTVGANVLSLLYYVVFGVGVPILIVGLFKKIKFMICGK